MPGPVRQRRVDEDADRHITAYRWISGRASARPGDDSRVIDRELQLEQREHDQRNRRRQIRMRQRADAR